jgi:hypothetical protein
MSWYMWIILAFIGCTAVVMAAATLVMLSDDGLSALKALIDALDEEPEDPIEAEYRVESIRGRLE